jgi:hypothetical protein
VHTCARLWLRACVRACLRACVRVYVLPACARPSNLQNYTETQRGAYYDIFICTAHSLQFPPYDTILIFYCTLTAASTVRHDVFFILTQHWTIFFARYTSAAYSFFIRRFITFYFTVGQKNFVLVTPYTALSIIQCSYFITLIRHVSVHNVPHP